MRKSETAAAASTVTQPSTDLDPEQAAQVVTLGVLKSYMDENKEDRHQQMERLGKLMDDKFTKLQTEFIGQKKEMATIKKQNSSIMTAIATNDRKVRDMLKAKKELIIQEHLLKSKTPEEMRGEVTEFLRNIDKELKDYEIRSVYKVGKEEFIRYVVNVSSDHTRDRLMCKAKDKNIINLKAGQSKLDGQEKARIHAMKQECHDKNEKILRCFFMGSLDSGRGTEATDSQISSIRSESPQARFTVPFRTIGGSMEKTPIASMKNLQLTISYNNARSLRNKTENYITLLNEQNPDLICLTETHFPKG